MIEAEREGEGVLITPRMGVLGVIITRGRAQCCHCRHLYSAEHHIVHSFIR
jgi:hypothetical protein